MRKLNFFPIIIIVLLLTAAILVCYPLTDASDGPVYLLACSDFQAPEGHAAGAESVSEMLSVIKEGFPAMDGFICSGDYDYNFTDSLGGILRLRETVREAYGTQMDEIWLQGNHDDPGMIGSYCTPSGANDTASYGVYVINEADYMWYNDDEGTIRQTATSLKAYLDEKRAAGYAKPIFVVSHVVLHYGMRTYWGGGDAMHANYLFDVLNEAGNAGLNIIFLFGHNHSYRWDDYLGGASIFLTKGDSIYIAQNDEGEYREETLAFTYMNAGYIGYYGDVPIDSVDQALTMTVFEITDTTVTIYRYDREGLHNLKSPGYQSEEYHGTAYLETDPDTVSSPYILQLNTDMKP